MNSWIRGQVAHISLGASVLECRYNYWPGDPGRTSGPPEQCYPPEPAELEIVAVTLIEGKLLEVLEELSAYDPLAERLLDHARGIE